jgi:hypothetical protein
VLEIALSRKMLTANSGLMAIRIFRKMVEDDEKPRLDIID